VTAGLAALSFLVLVLSSARTWGFALAIGAAAALILWRRRARDLTVESLLLAAGVLAGYARESSGAVDWALALAAVSLVGLIAVQPQIQRLADGEIRTANLGLTASRLPSAGRIGDWLRLAVPALIALMAASAALELPSWPATVIVVLVAAAFAGAVAELVRQRLRRSSVNQAVRRELERHQPEFVLHFSAPPRTEYQVLMWLPYLERIGRPFFIMLREPHSMAPIAAATSAPVVVCSTLAELDAAMVPSLRAVFYVNHASKVAHTVRYANLAHVQLHHGDSDKAPSASPVTAMFTKVFVAGQAAIDRYARNGVDIPREKFVVVGRPQVESIERDQRHISAKADKVVLYTPTWTGYYSDSDYCSLPVARTLIEHLLARDVTVILRAHPYTTRHRESARHLAGLEQILAADRETTGRQHVWGPVAAKQMSLVDCINRSDALVSDVSSVISDYLFSGKPFAITDVMNEGDNIVESFPVARGGYVLRSDMSNVDKELELLLNDDPLEEARREMRAHYLGDFPADGYAEAFLAAARDCLAPRPSSPI
jgi:hypothetical protein